MLDFTPDFAVMLNGTLAERTNKVSVNTQRSKCIKVTTAFVRLGVAFFVEPFQSCIQALSMMFGRNSCKTHWGIQ